MESLEFLMGGFATALQPTNLLFAFIGCFLGTMVGVLPGLGSAATIGILLPITFVMDPLPAIIMLAAIYYGSMYGGTITAVLMNLPGEASAAVSTLDGYPMAMAGRGGSALTVAAIGSFVGGTIAAMGLVFLALPITALALRIGPPEFFAILVLALSLVTGLAGRSMVRAMISAIFGLMIAMIGIDPVMGAPRYHFGRVELLDGAGLIPVIMGLFGLGEIFVNAERRAARVMGAHLRSLLPRKKDITDSVWPILRGSGIGFFVGMLPGVGNSAASFMAYVTERRLSRTPEKFGTGMVEGISAPDAASNACANAALIPLFTLGIPGSVSVAIIMGAFMMHGLIPGPFLFIENPDLVWAVIASLYIGNALLLVINIPLIPMWVAMLRIPYGVLFPVILTFVAVGAYSLNNSVFDIGLVLIFGFLGYAFKKLDIPPAPLVLTLVLAPLMERGLRQSLEISRGDFTIFFTRPIAATALALAVLMVVLSVVGLTSQLKGGSD
jgi:putative tricarboxylic transport membrane protein